MEILHIPAVDVPLVTSTTYLVEIVYIPQSYYPEDGDLGGLDLAGCIVFRYCSISAKSESDARTVMFNVNPKENIGFRATDYREIFRDIVTHFDF